MFNNSIYKPTLKFFFPFQSSTPSDLSAGAALSEALVNIEPSFFTPSWFAGICILFINSMYCTLITDGRISEQKCFLFTEMIFDQPSKITFRNFTYGKFCQAKPQLSSEPDAPLLQVTFR